MTESPVIRTGVELDIEHDAARVAVDATHRRELNSRSQAREVVLVRACPFVDLVLDREPTRWRGSDHYEAVEVDRDPTNQLMEIVGFQRQDLINLYADIAQELEQHLSDAWEPRAPRPLANGTDDPRPS